MITATLCVRDEEEIIETCLETLLAEGADEIIATDNGSVDSTRKILEKYRCEIIDRPVHDYRHGEWVTDMARIAFRRGATWVVNADADELWYNFSLVKTMPDCVSIVRTAPNYDHLPCPDSRPGKFLVQNYPFFTRSPHSLRLVHRATPYVIVSDGNHYVSNCPGESVQDDRIYIRHFPIRSYEQFEKKVVKGGTALKLSPQTPGQSSHWRSWYGLWEQGRLREAYDRFVVTPENAVNYLFNFNL